MAVWQTILDTFSANRWLTQLLLTAIAIIGFLILRDISRRFIAKTIHDRDSAYGWQRAVRLLTTLLLILVLIGIWLQSSGSVATYLGLLSAGLAIALQDFIANLASWAFIVLKRPFEVGDRIQVNQTLGDVVDIHFLQFTLLEVASVPGAQQNTGRLIHMPNRQALTQATLNETQEWPYLWEELPVLLTFESDWKRGKELVTEIVNRHAQPIIKDAEKHANGNHQMLIKFGKLTPIVYTSVSDSGVLLTMRFLSGVRGRRTLIQSIWEDLLTALAQEHTVDLAYLTRRSVTQFAPNPPGTPPVAEQDSSAE